MSDFLRKLEKLPHLLILAKEMDGNVYNNQNKLADKYRKTGKPFVYSMPERHLDICQICDYKKTSVLNTLEIPPQESRLPNLKNFRNFILRKKQQEQDIWHFDYYDIELHRWKEHGLPLPDVLLHKLSKLFET